MKDNRTSIITFRTSKELKEALQQMADKEKRNLSNMIEVILYAAVDAEAANTAKKKK